MTPTPTDAALDRASLSARLPLDLFESWPDPLAVLQHGIVLFANRALVSYAGFGSAREVEGRPATEFLHPEDRAPMVERMQAAIRSGTPNPPVERRLLRRDGTVVECEMASVALGVGAGALMIATVRDLSVRRALSERLASADRFQSLSTLAAGIAHEINNPMSYIVTNVEFASEEIARLRAQLQAVGPALGQLPGGAAVMVGLPRLAQVEEALSDALGGADRVRAIVRNLKILSRDDRRPPQRLDLAAALDSALEVAASEIRHRARLVRDLQPVPAVQADPTKLNQVLLNLLTNAAQAIEEGAAPLNEVRVVTGVDAQGHPYVEIRDTGSGISPEVRARMFDLFFTTKPLGVGRGLGLPVAHALVSGMGGEITVSENQPRGSIFRVSIPPAETPQLPAEAATARRRRILVVDDERAICSALKRILGNSYDVTTTTSSTEALEKVRQGERFDLILCDLMMPELTGMDLFDELSQAFREQASRMVFVTGGACTARAQEFLENSSNVKVDKPFNKDALLALVAERLGLGGA